jgi:hypothetical protein
MNPKKLENKLRKEEKAKKAITIEKKKEIVQKYESGVHVTDLSNMYSMSKSTISTILLVFLVNYAHYTTLFFIMKRLGKRCFGSFETHYRYFHYLLWEK